MQECRSAGAWERAIAEARKLKSARVWKRGREKAREHESARLLECWSTGSAECMSTEERDRESPRASKLRTAGEKKWKNTGTLLRWLRE